MSGLTVGIIGASGYSGIELTRLCAQHPHVDLRLLASDRWAGETPRRRLGVLGQVGSTADLAYTRQDGALAAALGCEVVFLATPVEASLELAPHLLEAGVRVVDLSGAFRLRDAAQYPRWYGLTHPRPALLADAVYGLPELATGSLASARLVANPGCYATAAALALAPLFSEGVIAADAPVIVDAASGTTGAGRKATEEMSFSDVDADFRAYRVHTHQHTPEISATLTRAAGHTVGLTFTAHILPLKRGILATAYARLAPGHAADAPLRALMHVYASANFVSVAASPDEVRLRDVVRTNRCVVSAATSDDGVIVVTAAIDNLLKGAAGQAVQNLNIMMGWDETTGLASLAFHGGHP